MGVIYRAHDPAIARAGAIKLVRADLLDGQDRSDYLERFQREARAAGRCAHPNIVAIYDFAVHDGNPFIAMEFVDGVNLAQLIARGPRLVAGAAIDVVLQLLAALDCAHGLGVVHRDVKPANLMVVPGGRVKVTDFGISSLVTSSLTQQGAVLGTPSYMSPEQCRGDPVDGRSDLFSAGGVLHELLTGQRPFPGSSFTEVAHRLLHEPTARIPAGAPPSVQGVLDRAMAKRAEDRYPTAASMAAALRAASSDTDATLVDATLVDAPPAEFAPHSALDHAARHVGPIARYLVQTASSAATSIEELCGTLGSNIKQDASRQAFLDDVLGPVRSRGGSAAPAAATSSRPAPPPPALALPPEAVEQLQRELSRYIGPIAKVLVRRALAASRTEQELRRQLAEHIDQPEDRAAFLRQS